MDHPRLFALLLLLTGFIISNVKAQEPAGLPDLPTCAALCTVDLIPSSGCNATDVPCLCTSPKLNNDTAICIAANCTVPEALEAKKYHTLACAEPIRNDSALTKRVTWTMYSIVVVAVIGRFIFRHPRMQGNGYGLDDWTMALCLILLTPQQALLSAMLDYGLGRDIWMLTPYQITRILYFFWISEFFYNFVMCLLKISILLMYLRIWTAISIDSVRFRVTCFVLLGLLCATAVAMSIVVIFQCSPIPYAWHQWDGLHIGTCINVRAMIYAGAALNISYDIIVYLLPIPNLVKLNISTSKKVGICFVFLCSLFATICSIVRLRYLIKFGGSSNPTWYYNAPALWSAIECHVTAICACMPSLAGIFQRAWKKTFGSFSYGSRRSDEPGSGNTPTFGSRSRIPRRQLDEDDTGLELSRLRSTAGSIGGRVDSVQLTPKVDEGSFGNFGIHPKEWDEFPERRTVTSAQEERTERYWLELDGSS